MLPENFLSKFKVILNQDKSDEKSFDELMNLLNETVETPIDHQEALNFFISSKVDDLDLPQWFIVRLSEMRMSSGWED